MDEYSAFSSFSTLLTPRRKTQCLKEVSEPPDPVPLTEKAVPSLRSYELVSCHQSRLGPVVGSGVGDLQLPFSGEYLCCFSVPPACTIPDFSPTDGNDVPPFAITDGKLLAPTGTLRQHETGFEGAPTPPDPAFIAVDTPSRRSCSSPAGGAGAGGFRPATSGEYSRVEVFPISDSYPICSPVLPDGASSPVPHPADGHHLPHVDTSSCSRPPDSLRIYYQNVRGLRTKIDTFFLAVSEAEYDLIVLTETWLDDRIYSTQLFGALYTVYRTDRSHLNSRKSRGGGVLIAVSTKLSSHIHPAPISSLLEQIWVVVELPLCALSIGAVYLPPDRKNDCTIINEHVESLGSIASRLDPRSPALLFGDYNQAGLQWCSTGSGTPFIDPLVSHMPVACCALMDGFNLHGFTQINMLLNRNGRLLDLVFGNDPALPCSTVSSPIEPLVDLDPDHPALVVSFDSPTPIVFEPTSELQCLDFRRADYTALGNALSEIDWQFLESAISVNEAVDYFSTAVQDAILRVVPARRPPQKPPWSNPRLRSLKRERSAALRRYSSSRSPYYKRLFDLASHRYRRYNRFLYNRLVKRTEASLRSNPKQFWSFVNTKRKESGLPCSMFLGDCTANNEPEKCNLFAQHFKQVFHNFSASASQVVDATVGMPRDVFDFDIPRISEETVTAATRKLKLSFSPGPDGIPSSVVKRCADTLTSPLTRLYNLSVQHHLFPDRWKFSYLFPIHKKGDKRNIANYRGITSLCACSKLLEIIVNDALFACCKTYIDAEQHGFYPKRSVSTNLMQFTSKCLRTMCSGWQVDAAYMDLKAAFDTVDHEILLAKLERLGVSPLSVAWFRSYLVNRSLKVKIGATESDAFSNSSGVPQGSNLGPLLFTVFINDVSSLLAAGSRLFYADDAKIYQVVKTHSDCLDLQNMLSAFADWCSRNLMSLSIEKCNIISYHRKNSPILFDYVLSGSCIARVECVKDLGVILDSGLTFKLHYDSIVSSANRQLGFIFKVADEFRDPLCLRSLYCSLVRSTLESNAVVWCPFYANWIARIEAVQRKFVRYALRFLRWQDPTNLPPYEERCRLLSLEPLQFRRVVAQATFAAKLLNADIDCPSLLTQLNVYAPERLLRQRGFLLLDSWSRNYALHEPIRALSQRFNEHFELFDFNLSSDLFRLRLLNIFRTVGRNLN